MAAGKLSIDVNFPCLFCNYLIASSCTYHGDGGNPHWYPGLSSHLACASSFTHLKPRRIVNGKFGSVVNSWAGSNDRLELALQVKTACQLTKGVIVQAKRDVEQGYELRVCTNKACRKSGSLQTLELLRGLAPPNVSVESCGCLGRCGLGPNLVVLPAEIFVSHCNTATHAARLLASQCGASDPDNNLKALSLKQQGNEAFEHGDHSRAEDLYSKAIDLKPSGGLHLLFANRSATRLARHNVNGALKDAENAAHIAPGWPTALLRQAEAHMALGNQPAAHSCLTIAVKLEPSLRRSKSFQMKVREVEVKPCDHFGFSKKVVDSL